MSIKGVINPQQGVVGKVKVLPANKTTIAAPNFEPRINVSFSDLKDANTATKQDGDVVVYDATANEFTTKKLDASAIDITNINGGIF